MPDPTLQENLAQTLKRDLPTPQMLSELNAANHTVVSLPAGWTVHKIDDEQLLPAPRRTKSRAELLDSTSFIDFVLRYRKSATTVWCLFNPANSALAFTAVVDEHDGSGPGWRSHQASFEPRLSEEWKTWAGSNRSSMLQTPFATFLEDNEADIANVSGLPTAAQMMQLALAFEARAEQRISKKVNLSSGGVALEWVDKEDAATTEKMAFYEQFAVGIPVFWSPPVADAAVRAYVVRARLRYRIANPPQFWYELIRPDLVHQKAALELIDQIRQGIGAVPFLLGSAT